MLNIIAQPLLSIGKKIKGLQFKKATLFGFYVFNLEVE